MAIKIPDELKSDIPQTFWGKILTATPIIMTVIATALAGLASSEMTRAQFNESRAGQRQGKAGNQWGYFQAKRIRGTIERSTIDVLRSTTEIHPLDAATLDKLLDQSTLAALQQGRLPEISDATTLDPKVKAALDAVAAEKPDEEVAPLILLLSDKALDEAIRDANHRTVAFDNVTAPVNQAINRIENQLSQQTNNLSAYRDFIVARSRYTAARYDAEARLNQSVANLLELRVLKSNLMAERHQKRSKRFFSGMLVAQTAVIISTFAIATRQRSFLWGLAAAAGTAAVSFAIYVYLFV